MKISGRKIAKMVGYDSNSLPNQRGLEKVLMGHFWCAPNCDFVHYSFLLFSLLVNYYYFLLIITYF